MNRWFVVLIWMGFTALSAYGQFRPAELRKKPASAPPPAQAPTTPAAPSNTPAQATPAPAPAPTAPPAAKPSLERGPFVNPLEEVAITYGADKIADWTQVEVDTKRCYASPVIEMPRGYEVNHYRVTVQYEGAGTMEIAIAHGAENKLENILSKKHLRRPFVKAASGKEQTFTSPYRSENCAWVLLSTEDTVSITSITLTCLRGLGTLYGHSARQFPFAGATLPYRIMGPKYFDPNQTYPLVITIGGSGSIGTDNTKNMEVCGLARFLYEQYFSDPAFACFSLVPQITDDQARPAPYYPKGPQGGPTVTNPDLPLVNAEGWYTQATIALVRQMLADPAYGIDPNRIYVTGFSYGGKGTWQFLKAAPDLFAAALGVGGWAIGGLNHPPTEALRQALTQEVQAYKHVPITITAGEVDVNVQPQGGRLLNEVFTAAGGTATYVEFPKADHMASAMRTWTDRKLIGWLFAQKKSATTEASPPSP